MDKIRVKEIIEEYYQFSRKKKFTLSGMTGEGADFAWGYLNWINSSVSGVLSLRWLLDIQTEMSRQLDMQVWRSENSPRVEIYVWG